MNLRASTRDNWMHRRQAGLPRWFQQVITSFESTVETSSTPKPRKRSMPGLPRATQRTSWTGRTQLEVSFGSAVGTALLD